MTLRTLPVTLVACSVLAAPLPAAPPAAPPSALSDEKTCLMEYVTNRADMEKALGILRTCAERLPDSYAIRRTLGRKLLDLAGDPTANPEGARAALAHLEKAAALDPAQFADDWASLARLQELLGMEAQSLASYEQALPYLQPDQKGQVTDALWKLYRARGDEAKAIAVWRSAWYRWHDDVPSQRDAGRMLLRAGDVEGARAAYERALEIEPDDAATKDAHARLLDATARSGGSAEKNALLQAWLPKLEEADVERLEGLLEVAREALRADAARAIAEEIMARQVESHRACLVLAELRSDAGNHSQARTLAEKALRGSTLSPVERASAQAVLGKAIASEAYQAYSRSGSATSEATVKSVLALYRVALEALEEARAGGLAVDAEIASIEASIAALGGLGQDIAVERRRVAEVSCRELAGRARYQYDIDKPMRRTTTASVRLSRTTGGDQQGGALGSGTAVKLLATDWVGGECWAQVKADDGTAGWVPYSKLHES
jgi:Tfp pilus assembly protein PilF